MESPLTIPQPVKDPAAEIAHFLRKELLGLFQVDTVEANQQDKTLTFKGHLLTDADTVFVEIQNRFLTYGYTPMLRRRKGQDIVVAVKGVIDKSGKSNPAINILLFLATIVTTLAAGAAIAGVDIWVAVQSGSFTEVFQAFLAGLPFAITLLGILGVHELGHYLASRFHGVRATLPYFIPLPVIGIGTLGAFIQIKSPMTSRKVLFDIGMAGPYAGLLVAIPLLFLGMYLSLDNVVPLSFPGTTFARYGTSIFISGLLRLLADVPAGYTLLLDPILFAAWLGLFLTALNLIPAGQLDGGHAAYAVLGRRAHRLAYLVVFGLVIAGALQASMQWFIWAFFILLSGVRHPPPLNDITDVGLPRKALGVFSIVLFVLLFPAL